MITIRGILVPTDFSGPADDALAYAKRLAAEFGSRLHVLHVVSPPQGGFGPESFTFSIPTLLAELEADSRRRLDELVPSSDPLSSRAALVTTVGQPVADILDYVKANEIDLIVMGTHGRGFLGHMLLGSVAERIVRLAPVPVLTLRGTRPEAEGAVQATEARPREMVAS